MVKYEHRHGSLFNPNQSDLSMSVASIIFISTPSMYIRGWTALHATTIDGIRIRHANCTRQETLSSLMNCQLHPCHIAAAMPPFSRIFHRKYTLTKPYTAPDWSPQPRSGYAGLNSTEWDKKQHAKTFN